MDAKESVTVNTFGFVDGMREIYLGTESISRTEVILRVNNFKTCKVAVKDKEGRDDEEWGSVSDSFSFQSDAGFRSRRACAVQLVFRLLLTKYM